MATIEAQHNSVRDVFNRAVNAGKPAPAGAAPSNDSVAKDDSASERTVNDTVTLSEGGQKVVNLGRGRDLAQEFKNAPPSTHGDPSFAEALKQATADVFRITQLFTETIKSAFNWRR